MPIKLLDKNYRNSLKKQKLTPRISDSTQKVIRYDLDILVSGIQKYIRRGMIKECILFSYILFRMKGVFHRKLLERLIVIASEDIGIASLSVLPFVVGEVEKLGYFAKEYRSGIMIKEEVLFTMLVLVCVSQKDRSCDHSIYTMITRDFGKDVYEETKITEVNGLKRELWKRLVEGNEKESVYFAGQLFLGCKGSHKNEFEEVESDHSVYGVWEVLFRFYAQEVEKVDQEGYIKRNLDCMFKIFNYFFRLRMRARPELLQLSHGCMLMVKYKEILENSEKKGEIEILKKEDIELTKKKMKLIDPVHDFVKDKHTKSGREEFSRGFKHFIEVGSVLVNRQTWHKDLFFKKWKEYLIVDEKKRLENKWKKNIKRN